MIEKVVFMNMCMISDNKGNVLALDKVGKNYSGTTKTNAFCLGIILCNVSRSFDYLIYPYYPAYTS